jgi:hypothetical protein
MARKLSFGSLRVPVRFVGGVWECELGGAIPVRNEARAELVISPHHIADPNFLAAFEAREKYPVLDQGARLLTAVMVKPGTPPPAKLARFLIPFKDISVRMPPLEIFGMHFSTSHFVEVQIGPPGRFQQLDLTMPNVGLWLFLSGTRTDAIRANPIILPFDVPGGSAHSLNHALTILSEVYEKWRISHTGNIYERVFYPTDDGSWFPLGVLREAARGEHEELIAGRLRESFLDRMRERHTRRRRRK